jgi:hypothetical protein
MGKRDQKRCDWHGRGMERRGGGEEAAIEDFLLKKANNTTGRFKLLEYYYHPSLLSPFVVPKRKISILSIQLTFYMFSTFHFYNCIAH